MYTMKHLSCLITIVRLIAIKRVLLFFLLFVLIERIDAATYTVSNTNDAGAGSLRAAMSSAISNAGADNIVFTASGTLTLSSQLPTLTGTNANATIIDASTVTFTIYTNGNAGWYGINIDANACEIYGLRVRATGTAGVGIYTGTNGTNAIIGASGKGNQVYDCQSNGIYATGATPTIAYNTCYNNGGTNVDDANGISVTGINATITYNTCYGNGGANSSGTGNYGNGIHATGTNANITYNTCYDNGGTHTISTGSPYGNGIFVTGSGATISNNTTYGNGGTINNTSAAGGPYGNGIEISGINATISNNISYSNGGVTNGSGSPTGSGIYISETGGSISGNTVYSNGGSSSGTGTPSGLGIQYSSLDNGSVNISNNVVYSNLGDGIYIGASNVAATISNNKVGVNSTASTCAGNNNSGINLAGGTAGANSPTITNNVISCNGNGTNNGYGIYLSYYDNVIIKGNTIGALSGNTCPGNGPSTYHAIFLEEADNNVIGGTNSGEPNKITGHNAASSAAVYVAATSTGNSIIGNVMFCNRNGITFETAGASNSGIGTPGTPANGGGTVVTGTAVTGNTVHIYRANNGTLGPITCTATENQQGGKYLGSTVAAGGTWSYDLTAAGYNGYITVTQTDASGNTSRFSPKFNTGITGVFDYTNCGGLLPIELARFDADCENNAVRISWSTATETNSEKFLVEKSENGFDFNTIDVLPAAGFSLSEKYYSSLDATFSNGAFVYYRLTEVDIDGAMQQSELIAHASCSDEPLKEMIVFPNPANEMVRVILPALFVERLEETTMVSVKDMTGKLIYETSFNPTQSNVITLNTSTLASGLYVISCYGEDVLLTAKLVKQ
jgi:Secretion system C-terminal sorting domain